MHRTLLLVITLSWIGIGGCEPAPVPEVQAPTRADSIGLAMQAFDTAVFDTITWESDSTAVERGRLVFRISCSKCHGSGGAGDGRFVLEGDTLQTPSFLAEDWRFAAAPTELRRYIFSGNVAGMPYWGLVGLKYSDIDAVARFLEGPLRTEMSALRKM
jgi:mono/diheme cytochrome c family protein